MSMVHRFLELKSRPKSLPLGRRTRSRRLDLGNDVLPADEIDEAQSTRLSEGDSSTTDA